MVYSKCMEKDPSIPFTHDASLEKHPRQDDSRPRLIVRPPLTPDAIEAMEELCQMSGIDPSKLSKERLEELCKLWE